MSEVSIDLIKKLRESTGAGMMDCKRALVEHGGDLSSATEWLRKKGLAAASKKASRPAAEGLVAVKTEGGKAVMMELNAETDFVAKNEQFRNLANRLVALAFNFSGDLDAFKQSTFEAGKTVEDAIAENIGVIGENIKLSRLIKLEIEDGVVFSYMHNAVTGNLGKIGALVALETNANAEQLQSTGKQLAMHVAAANPEYLTADDIESAIVEKERQVFKEQSLASGKPENVVNQMVEGRIRKFYEQVALLDQLFVIDGKTKISSVLQNASQELGTEVKIHGYARYSVGGTSDAGN